MARTNYAALLSSTILDDTSAVPLYKQLYEDLRGAILAGRLAAGTRLPSTRTLADELDISRNTVTNAFDQLLAEGYLESHVGDGTYVARTLPDELLHITTGQPSPLRTAPKGRYLSQRGTLLAQTPVGVHHTQANPYAFCAGLPALDAFPFDSWARLEARYWQNPPRETLTYGSAAGYKPLREAVAGYLGTARAVHCSPEQVIIVAGSQQALDLAGRVLLDPGDSVWIEDPGYLGARGAFIAAGAHIVPVPLDAEGLSVEAGIQRCADARLAYVSPSHQLPLGITMSLTRRLALLEWANQAAAWVLEDDYDSEYRYVSRPLAAMQGLDREQRVIYMGTFSKVLFPALRLGYLVVPPDLVDAFSSARALADRHSPLPQQAVLTDFITEGHFARHIRRMRTLYAERQGILLRESERLLTGLLDVRPAEAGMHVMGWLPDGVNDRYAAEQAQAYGLEALPLSAYSLEPQPHGGLLLGYAAINEREIQQSVQQLALALTSDRGK